MSGAHLLHAGRRNSILGHQNQSGTVRPKACSILQHFLMRFLDGAKPPSISFCTIQYMEEYGGCSNGLVPTLCWKLCSASQSTLAFATAQRRNYKASQPWLQFCLLTEFNVLYTLYTHTVKSAKKDICL